MIIFRKKLILIIVSFFLAIGVSLFLWCLLIEFFSYILIIYIYFFVYIYIYIPFKINLLEIFVYIFATYADYLDTYVAHRYIFIKYFLALWSYFSFD